MSWLCRTLGHKQRALGSYTHGPDECPTTVKHHACKRCGAKLTTHDTYWRDKN